MYDSVYFFFFKQKTAYEMRISDWSSDVCSSDLPAGTARPRTRAALASRSVRTPCGQRRRGNAGLLPARDRPQADGGARRALTGIPAWPKMPRDGRRDGKIGRASWRERVCQYVEISVVAVSYTKKDSIQNF